jgi:flagellar protein FlaI
MTLLDHFRSDTDADTGPACDCQTAVADGRLTIRGEDCGGGGDLAARPACRTRAVRALGGRTVDGVRSRSAGLERVYRETTADLLVAAGRFADAAAFHEERVAALACRDPVAAATEAAGRADAIGDLGGTSGLVEAATAAVERDGPFRAFTGPTVSRWLVDPTVPTEATLQRAVDLETGGTARLYTDCDGHRRYLLEPLEATLDRRDLATLDRAQEVLAAGETDEGPAAPGRAVRSVAGAGEPVEALARVLRKHTRGAGLLADLFADPAVSDVFVTAPATSNQLRVTVDGDLATTNVRLTERGVAALASRFRRESGRAFSRAAPVLDTTARMADRRVRVAGVTDPASRGLAFAFRAHERSAWTLPDLVANDTISPTAAGLVSVAATRGAAMLFAGPRGAGKTTMLGAVLWELPVDVRTVVIEDAPELPLDALQADGRDVQGLTAARGDTELDPETALRTALRFGDGALVVGEVRGAEAGVLYEAMRVGANSEAVLGTIHGTDAATVRDRVVDDLGVAPGSFGATDLVVSLAYDEADGTTRTVRAVEEVDADGAGAADLLARTGEGLAPTGRLKRGNSTLLATLSRPSETYADVLEVIEERGTMLEKRAGAVDEGPLRRPPAPAGVDR